MKPKTDALGGETPPERSTCGPATRENGRVHGRVAGDALATMPIGKEEGHTEWHQIEQMLENLRPRPACLAGEKV